MIGRGYVSPRMLGKYLKDPLYRNSLFLVMNRALVVLTGFVFWLVATRLYAVDDVGIAVAFVSSAQLICSFSLFGFDTSIIRFFNDYDRSKIFSTSVILVSIFSLLAGAVFILGVRYFSPDLAILHEPLYAAIFLLFTMGLTLSIVTSQTFVAMRDAKYSFIQNMILTLRIPLLIPLVFLGSLGILGATFAAYIAAYVAVFYFLSKFFRITKSVDRDFIRRSYKFSFGNYVSSLIFNAAYSILPLIVLNVSGKADAGLYYIGFTVGYFALQIPTALSTSFFVEGVYGESLRKSLKKVAMMTLGILTVTVVFLVLLGGPVLSLFGGEYVEAVGLLRLIAISSFFYAGYIFFTIILNMKMRVNYVLILNVVLFILIDGLSYLLIGHYGITGIGYAFIIAYGLVDLYILYLSQKWGWI
jgi:O-antigen/teichoic acid export membrane protein